MKETGETWGSPGWGSLGKAQNGWPSCIYYWLNLIQRTEYWQTQYPTSLRQKSSENFCFRIKGTSSQPSITVVRFPYLLRLGMDRGHFEPAGLWKEKPTVHLSLGPAKPCARWSRGFVKQALEFWQTVLELWRALLKTRVILAELNFPL